MKHLISAIAALAILVPAVALANPLAPGWTLKSDASALRFQSVKNTTVVESSSFATLAGTIAADGTAEVRILLDSVDTKIDLRNVRMRFLFFETFKYPEAIVRLTIDPTVLADLPDLRRKTIPVTYTLELHGLAKELSAEVAVTLLSDDIVSIASSQPISISVTDFGLSENIRKLEEAAGGISIIPSATVSFDFMFTRNAGPVVTTVAQASAPPEQPTSVALEARGDFTEDACRGRFEIMSRAGNIYFTPGSARLSAESSAMLDALTDIVRRCPGLRLEVAGHTDSDGSKGLNQRLSEDRARSVASYLTSVGIDPDRLVARGYGEDRPVFPNDSAYHKSRNRRIEFVVIGG